LMRCAACGRRLPSDDVAMMGGWSICPACAAEKRRRMRKWQHYWRSQPRIIGKVLIGLVVLAVLITAAGLAVIAVIQILYGS
jgi:hypothetical protein